MSRVFPCENQQNKVDRENLRVLLEILREQILKVKGIWHGREKRTSETHEIGKSIFANAPKRKTINNYPC